MWLIAVDFSVLVLAGLLDTGKHCLPSLLDLCDCPTPFLAPLLLSQFRLIYNFLASKCWHVSKLSLRNCLIISPWNLFLVLKFLSLLWFFRGEKGVPTTSLIPLVASGWISYCSVDEQEKSIQIVFILYAHDDLYRRVKSEEMTRAWCV